MSSLKWRTDFESLEDDQRCIALVCGSVGKKVLRRFNWCSLAKRFWCRHICEYIESEVIAFIPEQELIELFHEQFPQQPTTGEKP